MHEDRSPIEDARFYISGVLNDSRCQALPDSLPDIPTMISTRLRLELLLQEHSVDLGAVSEVILADPGATLQLLRLVGEEYPDEEDRPTRIEDCVVSLSVHQWYEVVCALTIPHSSQLLEHWVYLRRVAQCAKELAKCVDGVSPEEAYLVGLLSQVGSLPEMLGWNNSVGSSKEHGAIGVMLAECWHLPAYLRTAIEEHQGQVSSRKWTELLELARDVAAVDTAEGSFANANTRSL